MVKTLAASAQRGQEEFMRRRHANIGGAQAIAPSARRTSRPSVAHRHAAHPDATPTAAQLRARAMRRAAQSAFGARRWETRAAAADGNAQPECIPASRQMLRAPSRVLHCVPHGALSGLECVASPVPRPPWGSGDDKRRRCSAVSAEQRPCLSLECESLADRARIPAAAAAVV